VRLTETEASERRHSSRFWRESLPGRLLGWVPGVSVEPKGDVKRRAALPLGSPSACLLLGAQICVAGGLLNAAQGGCLPRRLHFVAHGRWRCMTALHFGCWLIRQGGNMTAVCRRAMRHHMFQSAMAPRCLLRHVGRGRPGASGGWAPRRRSCGTTTRRARWRRWWTRPATRRSGSAWSRTAPPSATPPTAGARAARGEARAVQVMLTCFSIEGGPSEVIGMVA